MCSGFVSWKFSVEGFACHTALVLVFSGVSPLDKYKFLKGENNGPGASEKRPGSAQGGKGLVVGVLLLSSPLFSGCSGHNAE